MNGFDRHQAVAALVALVTALFVAAGAMPTWRRQLRAAAIIGFAIALGVALVEIALWLAR